MKKLSDGIDIIDYVNGGSNCFIFDSVESLFLYLGIQWICQGMNEASLTMFLEGV